MIVMTIKVNFCGVSPVRHGNGQKDTCMNNSNFRHHYQHGKKPLSFQIMFDQISKYHPRLSAAPKISNFE